MARPSGTASPEPWPEHTRDKRRPPCVGGAAILRRQRGAGSPKPARRKRRIDGKIGARDEFSITFDEAITSAGGFESGSVERTMLERHSSKNAIEQEESNSEIGVHAALV